MVERRRAKRCSVIPPAAGDAGRPGSVMVVASRAMAASPAQIAKGGGTRPPPAVDASDQPRRKLLISRSSQPIAWSIVSPPWAMRAMTLVLIAWM